MNKPTPEEWLESYSSGFVDRRGRPVKNKDAEKMLIDADYRTVGSDKFKVGNHEVHVSTIFLGLPVPKDIISDDEVCYETMIFGGAYDNWQHRWSNAAQASKAHKQIVAAVQAGNPPPFDDTNIFTAFKKAMEDEANEGEEWKQV